MICSKEFKTKLVDLEHNIGEFLTCAYPNVSVKFHNLEDFASKFERGQNILQIEVNAYLFGTDCPLALFFVSYNEIDCLDKNFHLILARLVHEINSTLTRRIGNVLL